MQTRMHMLHTPGQHAPVTPGASFYIEHMLGNVTAPAANGSGTFQQSYSSVSFPAGGVKKTSKGNKSRAGMHAFSRPKKQRIPPAG